MYGFEKKNGLVMQELESNGTKGMPIKSEDHLPISTVVPPSTAASTAASTVGMLPSMLSVFMGMTKSKIADICQQLSGRSVLGADFRSWIESTAVDAALLSVLSDNHVSLNDKTALLTRTGFTDTQHQPMVCMAIRAAAMLLSVSTPLPPPPPPPPPRLLTAAAAAAAATTTTFPFPPIMNILTT
jgi:hypothetical protein